MLRIQGECNRCGQCCGAPGSPNRDSPWPNNWPEALANWSPAALEQLPLFIIVVHPAQGGPQSFAMRLGNKTYRGIWVPGHGLCVDLAPFGDPTAYEEQCPFLAAQEPDESYPCALVGTQWEFVYTNQCLPIGELWEEDQVAEWQANHPLCSYTWLEEPEE